MESHGVGCVTPVSANVPPLSSAQLAVGQLPSMQQLPQIRDPEWLKVEVCREFQRGACKRTSEDCRYAHPGKNIQITADGKVIACFDALKGRCNRESCKYLHPTYQLKQQLEITGRQTLLQNRAMLQQMLPLQQNVMPATIPIGYEQVAGGAAQPFVGNLHPTQLYSSAAAAGSSAYGVFPSELSAINQHYMTYYPVAASPGHQLALAQHASSPQVAAMLPTGALRADKLEVCRDFQRGNCLRGEFECRYCHPPDRSMIDVTDNTVTVCMDCIKGRCTREKCKYFHPPAHLQAKIRAAQNPAAAGAYLPSLAHGTLTAAAQPTMMMTNGTGIGQPPLKRHAIEPSIITSSASGLASSPGLSPSTVGSQNAAALAALYAGYNTSALSALTAVPQAVQTATPAYYPQGVQMLQLYGGAGGALATSPAAAAAAAAQNAQLTAAFNLPSTSASTPSVSAPSYALLNGQNSQFCTEYPIKAPSSPQQQQINSATTMTVCRDFQSGKCARPFCRFVHVREDYVEIKDDKVTVCRNALQGRCARPQCKFFHPPNSPANPSDGVLVDPHHLTAFAPLEPATTLNGLTHPALMGVLSGGVLPTIPSAYPSPLQDGSGVSPV